MFRGQDAWRRHHLLTGCWKNPLPGLGAAIVIFTGYCVVEAGFKYVTGQQDNVWILRINLLPKLIMVAKMSADQRYSFR